MNLVINEEEAVYLICAIDSKRISILNALSKIPKEVKPELKERYQEWFNEGTKEVLALEEVRNQIIGELK
jgi:hypothetical protein